MNEINYRRLIEEKVVDEIHLPGNKRNNYINSVFAKK